MAKIPGDVRVRDILAINVEEDGVGIWQIFSLDDVNPELSMQKFGL